MKRAGIRVLAAIAISVFLSTPAAAWQTVSRYQGGSDPTDWASTPNDGRRAFVSPTDGASVYRNPPEFVWPWPDHNVLDLVFEVELRHPDNRVERLTTTEPWAAFWPDVLPRNAQSYVWRVRARYPDGRPLRDWTSWRRFSIRPDAVQLSKPDVDKLYLAAARKPRPRTFPIGVDLDRLRRQFTGPGAPFSADWRRFVAELQDEMKRYPAMSDPLPGANGGRSAWDATGKETSIALRSAMVWRLTGETSYRDRAKRRALNLADWDPLGATACNGSSAQACLRISWSMALLYDWLYDAMTAIERGRLKSAVLKRLSADGMPRLMRDLNMTPLSSYGSAAHVYTVTIACLMAGEDPRVETLFRARAPLFLSRPTLFSADDGGYGNGMAYGVYNIASTRMAAYVLKKTTGYDLSAHPQFVNEPYFWLYVQPPVPSKQMFASGGVNSPGFFGDGGEEALRGAYLRSEMRNLLSTLSLATAPTWSSIRWYADRLDADQPRALDWRWMLNPVDVRGARLDANLPTSALFPEIGWAAMHSSLTDLNRTSLYFKSSRYGSLNHSHADQNSFVLQVGGVPLLIDSGYYDSYGSRHHKNWYQQTKAHNAVTFDDGQGQAIQNRFASGRIVSYADDPALKVTHVVGDAVDAYNGALNRARRSIAFMKPNVIVVYDRLGAETPKQWEWNLHAVNRMTVRSPTEVKVENRGESACVAVYSTAPLRFEQTDQFGRNNEDAPMGVKPKQWHGRFVTVQRQEEGKFLTIIRVGCRDEVQLRRDGDVVRVVSGGTATIVPEAGDIQLP